MMRVARYNLIIIFLLILSISLIIFGNSYAEESRATKIIHLTKENSHPNISSIKNTVNDQIQILRERYPDWSEEQFSTMKATFEDMILENVKALIVKAEDRQIEKNLIVTPFSAEKQPKRIDLPDKKYSVSMKDDALRKKLESEAKRTIISLIVKDGDTLGAIAKRNYNDSNMYIAIYNENKNQLESPHAIPIGITLKVPKINVHMKTRYIKMLKKYKKKERNKQQKIRIERKIRVEKLRIINKERVKKERQIAEKLKSDRLNKKRENSTPNKTYIAGTKETDSILIKKVNDLLTAY